MYGSFGGFGFPNSDGQNQQGMMGGIGRMFDIGSIFLLLNVSEDDLKMVFYGINMNDPYCYRDMAARLSTYFQGKLFNNTPPLFKKQQEQCDELQEKMFDNNPFSKQWREQFDKMQKDIFGSLEKIPESKPQKPSVLSDISEKKLFDNFGTERYERVMKMLRIFYPDQTPLFYKEQIARIGKEYTLEEIDTIFVEKLVDEKILNKINVEHTSSQKKKK